MSKKKATSEDISNWIITLIADHREQLSAIIATLPPREKLQTILRLLPYIQAKPLGEHKQHKEGKSWDEVQDAMGGVWLSGMDPEADWKRAILDLKELNPQLGYTKEDILDALENLEESDLGEPKSGEWE